MPFTSINWLRDRLFTSIRRRRRRALAPLAPTAIAMPSCFTLDSASDDGRSTAQGQGWPAGVGGFLSGFFSAGAARADGGKPSPDWDAHGLAASALPVPLSRLDGKKRYKVSDLTFLNCRTRAAAAAAAEAPLFDALRPGGVYTRAQLRDELDALAASGMFDHVTFQTKPKPDGTLGPHRLLRRDPVARGRTPQVHQRGRPHGAAGRR